MFTWVGPCSEPLGPSSTGRERHPYRSLIVCPRSPPPIRGFFLTHQKSFPSPTLDSSGCDMRPALQLRVPKSLLFFSKTIPPPNPFPLGYLHLQSNWIPSRSRASTLNLQTWVVAVESSRYVFFFFSPSCPSGAHVTGIQTDPRSEKSRWWPWRAWWRQPRRRSSPLPDIPRGRQGERKVRELLQ